MKNIITSKIVSDDLASSSAIIILPYHSAMRPMIEALWDKVALRCFTDNYDKALPAPDLIIGDMDSIGLDNSYLKQNTTVTDGHKNTTLSFPDQNSLLKNHTQWLHITDQNTTDSEKAILWLFQKKMQYIYILGEHGQFLDHHLYNLSLLMKYHQAFQHIELITQNERCFLLSGKVKIHGKKGQRISFFAPFGKVFVHKCVGLEYSINQMSLCYGGTSSSSNALKNSVVSLHIDGFLLGVLTYGDGMISY